MSLPTSSTILQCLLQGRESRAWERRGGGISDCRMKKRIRARARRCRRARRSDAPAAESAMKLAHSLFTGLVRLLVPEEEVKRLEVNG